MSENIGVINYMVGADGVAPPESEDIWFTVKPATIYGISSHINRQDVTIAGSTIIFL